MAFKRGKYPVYPLHWVFVTSRVQCYKQFRNNAAFCLKPEPTSLSTVPLLCNMSKKERGTTIKYLMLKTQLQAQQQVYNNLREFHLYKMQLARFSHGVMQPSLYLSCLRFDVIEEEKAGRQPTVLTLFSN